mmetsp:Transcript_52842/g.171957  ORF Transcript_52842/g.171957 Transcript_52842/m.171957 type:complete len:217 (-) Transcript_52842:122-772(-)
MDFSIFCKATSHLTLHSVKSIENGAPSGTEMHDAVAMHTYVREQKGVLTDAEQKGVPTDIDTRVYAIFLFDSDARNNLFRFTIFSSLMLNLTSFLASQAGLHDMLGVALAIILSTVALLFSLPADTTTTSIILTAHLIYEVTLTMLLGTLKLIEGDSHRHVGVTLTFNLSVTLCTVLFSYYEAKQYWRLIRNIKTKMNTVSKPDGIGSFEEIDNEI